MPSLSVGAIHIIVSHRDIESALGAFPQLVEKLVIALERLVEVRSVACFTIFDIEQFHAFRDNIPDLMPVHPSIILIFLHAAACDIFAAHCGGLAYHMDVCLNLYCAAFLVGLQFHIWSNLTVIGELTEKGIASHFGIYIIDKPRILPLRDGAADQCPKRAGAYIHLKDIAESFVVICSVPTGFFFPCIIADVPFRDAVVGLGTPGLAIGIVPTAFPIQTGADFHSISDCLENKAHHPAADVAESIETEKPGEHGNSIGPFFQVGGYLNLVIV